MKTLQNTIAGLIVLAVISLSVLTLVLAEKPLPGSHGVMRKAGVEPGQEPNDWMAIQRSFPYGRIKPESYLAAVRQAGNLMKSSAATTPWTFAGPDNIGGRITDIEGVAGDPNTLYIGAATGGVFKTTNGGATWQNMFENVPVISVGDIAIDPGNPLVIYAGTGEANAASFSFLGNGIYKSTDGGATWQHCGLENSAYIGRVLVDYSNSQKIFVAACGNLFTTNDQRGIYRSLDGGATWTRVLYITDSTAAIDIVQHPVNPQILFAAMWERSRGLTYRNSFGESSGLWKSADGGTSWTEVAGGLPNGPNVGRIGISIAKSNPDIMYAFYDLPNMEVAVYKSVNGGVAWTRTNDGTLSGMNSNFGWYFGQVRVDPADANRVFVMGVPLYRSQNGGSSWTPNYDPHVDHHAMYFHESTGRIWNGNDGGLYYSDTHGNSWTKVNNLPFTQFYAIDVDYTLPERIYGGTQDNNTIRTLSGGTSDWAPILGGDGMYTLVDYTNSDIIYAEYQWGNLYRSMDGGMNMEYIAGPMSTDRVNWSAPLAMDPATPATLYFGTYRIWKTTDRGTSWQPVSDDLTQGIDNYFYSVTTISISKINPLTVIAGTGDGKVHISQNGGLTWQNISAGLPARWVTHVEADPFDAQTIYATLSGFRWDEPLPHVFKSVNLGQTWTDISGNLPEFPVNDIVLDPDLPGRIIVGTDAGVYGTTDGGATWSYIFTGLPAVPVCALAIHGPSRTIFAGTYGLSAYRASFDEIFTGISAPGSRERLNLTVTPNPCSGNAAIHFYLPAQEQMVLKLYNMSGTQTRIFFSGTLQKGSQSLKVDLGGVHSGLAKGTYLLTAEGLHFSGSQKVIIY